LKQIIYVKLRHYEKAAKFEKNSLSCFDKTEKAAKFEKKTLSAVLTKQLFLLSRVKTIGRFFQIFLAFSEKLDFNKIKPETDRRYAKKPSLCNDGNSCISLVCKFF
jgi:hypothetical protein